MSIDSSNSGDVNLTLYYRCSIENSNYSRHCACSIFTCRPLVSVITYYNISTEIVRTVCYELGVIQVGRIWFSVQNILTEKMRSIRWPDFSCLVPRRPSDWRVEHVNCGTAALDAFHRRTIKPHAPGFPPLSTKCDATFDEVVRAG